jgi:hypothetical protein
MLNPYLIIVNFIYFNIVLPYQINDNKSKIICQSLKYSIFAFSSELKKPFSYSTKYRKRLSKGSGNVYETTVSTGLAMWVLDAMVFLTFLIAPKASREPTVGKLLIF